MDIETKQLVMAVRTIAEEKNLPEDVVQEAIEQALAAAWRRDFGDKDQEVRSVININDGSVTVFITKTVVDNVTNEHLEISLKDAQAIRKDVALDETVEIEEKVENFGRVAAQTAKQVILQRLREAEREVVLAEFEDKIHTVLNAIVTRIEGRMVRIEINRAQGILPPSEQIQGERYHPGQRLKVYLKDVERGFKGAQLVVSRGCPEFIEHLFRNEVPEMEGGAVEIKGIAREAGVRTKIAVASNLPGVDPVGTFVGGHGTRVQAVMSEIGEQEKIDIVVFASDTKEYIINALSPTKVVSVELNENAKKAKVTVEEDQLSIAIGRSGQNVRLASRLTGYDIDVVGDKPAAAEVPEKKDTVVGASNAPKLKKKSDLESSLLEAIEEHGE
ncbi:transcription termination/antitermination protein NusA [Candidatus Saccharibacteria bacterium]|nr:transcription termination/antitermination protein NusA [Candidatus Saccharibacteria bacterium]MCB9817258.1 transcription termination/antitermination protein NusA [Candidatus Nomurabacteria bacterium]HPD98756.1 transcription termination factor NusA [Candidatus Saccharibacteria bacterium]